MRRRLGLCLLAGLACAAHAESLYVGERILLGVYEEPDSQGERLMLLQSADRVEVLERRDGFALVRAPNGTEGWVSARYLTAETPSSIRVKELAKQNTSLQSELQTAREQLRRAHEDLEGLQAASAERATQGGAAARVSEPVEEDHAPAHWKLWLGLVAIGTLAGFGAGVWWIDRRVRNRFAGMRPY